MIPGVHISSGKASVENVNGTGGRRSDPLSGGFRGQSSLRKFEGSKEHLDWLNIDSNAAEIITVQDYKRTNN